MQATQLKGLTVGDIQSILDERDSYWKIRLLDLIKHIDLDVDIIEEEEFRKWYKFGAYDFGAKISDKIKEM
jgi:hypothetical protein